MIDLLPSGDLSLSENPELSAEILWRLEIAGDGSVRAQIPPKGQLTCTNTLIIAAILRKIAKRLEETAISVQAELYGKEGNA